MNNSIDEWLQELGFNDESHDAVTTVLNTPPEELEAAQQLADDRAPAIVEEPAAPTQELSEDDFNDILDDLGFNETPEAEAEEITDADEDEDEVYDENQGEGRDLDAEEDADWDERIESGEVQEVHFHMPNSEVISVPVEHENDSTQVEATNSDEERVSEPLLPENSPTLLMDDSTSRFSGTEWFEEIQRQRIIIAGCGGIGSNLAFQIARMHPETMLLYDDDRVELANMSGQLFSRDDVGKSKVDAINNMIRKYTSTANVYANCQKFTSDTYGGNIMMCGFDNMNARKTFFNKWYEHLRDIPAEERKQCLFLDGRLSIDTLQVLCLTGDDVDSIERYSKQYLFSDSEADATVCSMKQTTYLACMIASVMTNLFTNFVANLLTKTF